MKKINVGGCSCRDCGGTVYPDRAWWKRIWKKEINDETRNE